MKRALILTVGTGTRSDVNIVNPLVKTVRNSHPDILYLLASDASRPFAEQIVQKLKLTDEQACIVSMNNPDRIQDAYQTANSVIRALNDRGFECSEISVDYTSGTKAMTGGLLLSAVANACDELKYISGNRLNGVVVDGTEMFLTLSPTAILAHREIEICRLFILKYRFDAALDLFGKINSSLLDKYEQALVGSLRLIAEGYSAWDKFNHAVFGKCIKNVPFEQRALRQFQVGDSTLVRLKRIGQDQYQGRVSEDLLADLYNNACRRMEEGKFDDAMARLYRLTEMLAQWALARRGITTSEIDIEKAPEDLRSDLLRCQDPVDGKIKAGLIMAYRILAGLGEELGREIMADKSFRGRINSRNNSILAHGSKPIEEQECRSLLEILKKMMSAHVPDFDRRVEELKFPWSS